jgi:hypothetical protein
LTTHREPKRFENESPAAHLALADRGDRVWVFGCQSEQDPSRPLVAWQLALKDNRLIRQVAAADMADRDYQSPRLATFVQIELARSRQPATILPLGVSPEPSAVTPSDFVYVLRHGDRCQSTPLQSHNGSFTTIFAKICTITDT